MERENTGYAIEALRRLGRLDDLRHVLAASHQPIVNIAPQQPIDSHALGQAIAKGIAGRGVVEIGEASVGNLSRSIARELAPVTRVERRMSGKG
jgi:hypothetical protein